MRRLWAHIIIAFTCMVTAFAVFPTLIKGISTNGDYKTRREFTFQLSQREASDEGEAPALTADSAREMASIMEERLIAAGVTSYELSTSGNDIVKVAFAADSLSQYNQITTYLTFSGSFALCNKNPDGEPIVASEFLDGAVYQKSANVNEEPTIIIPINTENEAYKDIIDWARKNPTEEEDSSASSDSEETQTVSRYYVYILYNYVPGDTYQTLQDTNKFNEKVLLTFDVGTEENESDFYFDLGNNKKAFSYTCHFSDANSNSSLDANEVSAAYDQAKFLVNLFNASALDYDVEVIKGLASGTEVYKTPVVESIFNYGSIAMTSTLIAAICAFLITAGFLYIFYHLGALSIVTTSTVSIFLSFLFMIVAGMEYNSLAIIAFVLVGALSVISGIIYCNKLKEESYRGRSLKKANAEASRKSTLPIIDMHVVTLAIGLMTYLLGGQALHSFGAILLLGSLVSALLNTLGLKGMMWLATNTTKLTGKYEVFAIDSSKVPDHMSEEKQTYFGAYADKDFTKNKKPVAIIALVAFVASFAGMIAAGVINHGTLFKAPVEKVATSEIYFVNTVKVLDSETKSPADKDAINNLLSNLKVYYEPNEVVTFDDGDKHATLLSLAGEISEFTVNESKTDDNSTIEYLHTYFLIPLKKALDGDKAYLIDKDGLIPANTSVNQAFEEYFELTSLFSSSVDNTLELKALKTVNNIASPDWNKIALATFIASLISTVYLLIRYRLSRGLATLLFPTVTSSITMGLFVLLGAIGLTLPASIAIAIPVATMFSYCFMILIANKERDLINDERVKDNSVEHREELLKKSLGMAFTPMIAVGVIGLYLFINFFGFGASLNSLPCLAGVFAILISLGIIVVTYVPLSNLLFKWFSNIHFDIKPNKKKKGGNAHAKKDSAEPEEAIFIGIND